MKEILWFERDLQFGKTADLLPYFLERLEGTIYRIEQKVKNVEETVLSKRYQGKWSVKENIGHLAEVDEIAAKRLDEMVKGIPTLSPAVFEPQDYNPWPIEKVVEYFKKVRQQNLKKYETLLVSDLVKSSIHPRLKVPMTPVDLAWFDAEHDDHHLLKISNILKAQSTF